MKLLEVLKLNVLQKFMVVKRQSDPNGAPCHMSLMHTVSLQQRHFV